MRLLFVFTLLASQSMSESMKALKANPRGRVQPFFACTPFLEPLFSRFSHSSSHNRASSLTPTRCCPPASLPGEEFGGIGHRCMPVA